MSCRHKKFDPACSSYNARLATLRREYKEQILDGSTPDADNFEVEDVLEVGIYLILKVTYPNCKNCSYEGTKIMVYEGVGVKDAIRWRTIDPHFRNEPVIMKEAPSPIARFPASPRGWNDAVLFCKTRSEQYED